jgi:hypothetical protein
MATLNLLECRKQAPLAQWQSSGLLGCRSREYRAPYSGEPSHAYPSEEKPARFDQRRTSGAGPDIAHIPTESTNYSVDVPAHSVSSLSTPRWPSK